MQDDTITWASPVRLERQKLPVHARSCYEHCSIFPPVIKYQLTAPVLFCTD